MATVEDPDGFSNVRDEDGKVIATVKNGQRFLAVKPFAKSALWEAWLENGIIGLIHASRVRVLPEEPLMKLNFSLLRPHGNKLGQNARPKRSRRKRSRIQITTTPLCCARARRSHRVIPVLRAQV